MSRMRTPGTSPVRFKVEQLGHTAGDLARLLAEALQNASLKQNDADAYERQAASERVKIRDYNNILFQLKERKRNPPARVRRMDPLNEYDEEAVKEEVEMIKARHANFSTMAAEFKNAAEKARRDASGYQRRLQDLSLSGKLRESEVVSGSTGDGGA